MKNLMLGLIISIIAISTPPLYAKQTQSVVNVLDTMGRPIKGAEVSVWEQDFDFDDRLEVITTQLIKSVYTDAKGNAEILFESDKPRHSIILFAQKAGFSIGWSGAFEKARITEIRIVLDRINATAGIVTDEDNQPITGAKITAYPVDDVMVDGALTHLRWPNSIFTLTTDHEGRFSFDSLAEWMEVSFRVEYPGRAYVDTNYNLDAQHPPFYKAGQKDIHIVMHPAGHIKGRILAKRGNKVDGIKLVARGEQRRNGKRFTTESDADGTFVFNDLPPDTYLVTTVTSRANLSQQLTAGAIAEVKAGKTVDNIKIRMRDPIQLDVMVNDVKTNRPVQNASVSVSQRRASEIIPHLDFRTTTDGSGIAQVLTLPGKCKFYASHDDYEYTSGEYLVKSSDTNISTSLSPKSFASGIVVYEDGRPAAGVEVRVSIHETEYKFTDRSGRFRIKFSERTAQKGFVIARDMKTGLAGVVDITESQGPVKVVLEQAATIKGRVVDPDNKPIEGARVRVLYNIPHALTNADNDLYTDQNGGYELRAIPFSQKHFKHNISLSAYGYSRIDYQKIEVNKEMDEIVELLPFVLKPCNMTLSGVAVYEDGTIGAYKSVHLNNVHHMHGQPNLHSVTDADGRFSFDGACEGWLRIQCGSPLQNDCGYIYAKGGDTVKIIMNNNHHSLQLHPVVDSLEGVKLPMYETLTKGIEAEKLENKKLLVCFWYIADEQKKIVKELAKITDDLDNANISVILVNARPYSKKYASVNIDLDKKWIKENKILFLEADVPDMNDIMEIRRAAGAKFIPHMILTDEDKVIINEGFDVQWLKDNVL